jgi:hypothetical protein
MFYTFIVFEFKVDDERLVGAQGCIGNSKT